MSRSQHLKNIHFYHCIEKIPEEIWTDLKCTENLYFHPSYLQSLEKNNSHFTFLYAVVKDTNDAAVAFASIQILDFALDSISNDNPNIYHKVIHLARKLKILPREKPLKILNCGNPFVSGEHGIFIKSDQNKKKILRNLAKSILEYTQKNYDFSIDVFIMKDFLEESLTISNELISLGYYAFNVEPNMKLNLDSNWNSLDDYLAAMKTKFRVKAKKAFELSNSLKVATVTSQNIDTQLAAMTKLYLKVASKASFNLGDFNLHTYRHLLKNFEKKYFLKSYWLDDKIVGFLSGIINKNSLDAHFVGIDYNLNKSHAIYQRMLYDYISIAIEHKLEIVNFGRTASEIKSSVGAVPEHLTIYIRHKKSITNKFLKLFLLKIQPTEFNQKFPFKEKK